jgi:hypothetical protein
VKSHTERLVLNLPKRMDFVNIATHVTSGPFIGNRPGRGKRRHDRQTGRAGLW